MREAPKLHFLVEKGSCIKLETPRWKANEIKCGQIKKQTDNEDDFIEHVASAPESSD